MTQEIAFIVGASIASVNTDVQRDFGWKRLGLAVWEDEEERIVKYLYDPSLVHGTRYALVYFANGFDQRDNWWKIDDVLRARDCERIYLYD